MNKDIEAEREHLRMVLSQVPGLGALDHDAYAWLMRVIEDQVGTAYKNGQEDAGHAEYDRGFADGHAQGTDDEANSSSADTLRDELKATRVKCAQLTEKLRHADSQIACLSVSAFRSTGARDLEFLMTGLRDLWDFLEIPGGDTKWDACRDVPQKMELVHAEVQRIIGAPPVENLKAAEDAALAKFKEYVTELWTGGGHITLDTDGGIAFWDSKPTWDNREGEWCGTACTYFGDLPVRMRDELVPHANRMIVSLPEADAHES